MLMKVFTLCTRAILSPEDSPLPFFFFTLGFFLNTHFTLLKKAILSTYLTIHLIFHFKKF